jgi:hypothetical protein
VLDGKIVECEAVRDRLDMILQMGGTLLGSTAL